MNISGTVAYGGTSNTRTDRLQTQAIREVATALKILSAGQGGQQVAQAAINNALQQALAAAQALTTTNAQTLAILTGPETTPGSVLEVVDTAMSDHTTKLEYIRIVLQAVGSIAGGPVTAASSLLDIAANVSHIAALATQSHVDTVKQETLVQLLQTQLSPILQRLVTIEHDLNINSSGVMTTEAVPAPAPSTTTGTPGITGGRHLTSTVDQTTAIQPLVMQTIAEVDGNTYSIGQHALRLAALEAGGGGGGGGADQAQVDALVASDLEQNALISNHTTLINGLNFSFGIIDASNTAQTALINDHGTRVLGLEQNQANLYELNLGQQTTIDSLFASRITMMSTDVSLDNTIVANKANADLRISYNNALIVTNQESINKIVADVGSLITVYRHQVAVSAFMEQLTGLGSSHTIYTQIYQETLAPGGVVTETLTTTSPSHLRQIKYMQYMFAQDPMAAAGQLIINAGTTIVSIGVPVALFSQISAAVTLNTPLATAPWLSTALSPAPVLSSIMQYRDLESAPLAVSDVCENLYFYITGTWTSSLYFGNDQSSWRRLVLMTTTDTSTETAPSANTMVVGESIHIQDKSSWSQVCTPFITPLCKAFVSGATQGTRHLQRVKFVTQNSSGTGGWPVGNQTFYMRLNGTIDFQVHLKWIPTSETVNAAERAALGALFTQDSPL